LSIFAESSTPLPGFSGDSSPPTPRLRALATQDFIAEEPTVTDRSNDARRTVVADLKSLHQQLEEVFAQVKRTDDTAKQRRLDIQEPSLLIRGK
jgi:hypothetical protein